MAGIDSYTILILNMNGTNGSNTFIDSSPSNQLVVPIGGAHIDTSLPKFGNGSCLLNGTTDCLNIPTYPYRYNTNLSRGDFTIECWVNFIDIIGDGGNGTIEIWSQGNNYDNCHRVRVWGGNQYVVPRFFYELRYQGSSIINLVWDWVIYDENNLIPLNTWFHLVYVRYGDNHLSFVNGTKLTIDSDWGSDNTIRPLNYTGPFTVGALYWSNLNYSEWLHGRVDGFGISKTARWTDNFTSPVSEYSLVYPPYDDSLSGGLGVTVNKTINTDYHLSIGDITYLGGNLSSNIPPTGPLPSWSKKLDTGALGYTYDYNTKIVAPVDNDGYYQPHLLQINMDTQDDPDYNINKVISNTWSSEDESSNYNQVFPSVLPNGDEELGNPFWQSVAMSPDGHAIAIDCYNHGAGINSYVWETILPSGSPEYSWRALASDSDGSNLLAGSYNGLLYTSTNYGLTWTQRTPLGITGNQNWWSAASNSTGSYLIVCQYQGYIYSSLNGGIDWTERTPAGSGWKNWRGVASSSNGYYFLACILNGRLYRGTGYGGTSWSEIRPGGDANYYWSCVASNSSGTVLVACIDSYSDGKVYLSSTSGSFWIDCTPIPNATEYRNWTSVAMSSTGNNLIVAANGGGLYTSSNMGLTWIEHRPAGDGEIGWASVASDSTGNNLVAAVYDGRIYTSSNAGSTWTEQHASGSDTDQLWNFVTSDSTGNLIAGSDDGLDIGTINREYYVYKVSSDYGKTWGDLKVLSTIGKFSNYRYAIDYDVNNMKFWAVFVASNQDGTGTTAALRYTADNGTTWVSGGTIPISGGGYSTPYSIIPFSLTNPVTANSWNSAGPPEGSAASLSWGEWISTVHSNGWWQVDTGNSPKVIKKLTIGSDASYIMSSSSLVASTDGINWTRSNISQVGVVYDGTYANNTFVFVGIGFSFTSTNGTSWTLHQSGPGAMYGSINGITYGNSLFIAVGGGIYNSSNGISWTQVSANGILDSVIYDGVGTFVAVGYNGGYGVSCTSSDGTTWSTFTNLPDSTQLLGVTYGEGIFVAVGSQANGGILYTSSNGSTWVQQRIPPVLSQVYKVTYGNGTFVAIASSNYVIISTDGGITWNLVDLRLQGQPSGIRFLTVKFNNGIFLLGGYNETLLTSTDGTTWTQIPGGSDNLVYCSAYGNGTFVIFDSLSGNSTGEQVAPQEFYLLASNTGSFSGEEVDLLHASNLHWGYYTQNRTWLIDNNDRYRFYRIHIVIPSGPIGLPMSSRMIGCGPILMYDISSLTCNDVGLNISKFSISSSEGNVYMLSTMAEGYLVLSAVLNSYTYQGPGVMPFSFNKIIYIDNVGTCKITSTGACVYIINAHGTQFEIYKSTDFGQNFSLAVSFDYSNMPIYFDEQTISVSSSNGSSYFTLGNLAGPVTLDTNNLGLTGTGAIPSSSPVVYNLVERWGIVDPNVWTAYVQEGFTLAVINNQLAMGYVSGSAGAGVNLIPRFLSHMPWSFETTIIEDIDKQSWANFGPGGNLYNYINIYWGAGCGIADDFGAQGAFGFDNNSNTYTPSNFRPEDGRTLRCKIVREDDDTISIYTWGSEGWTLINNVANPFGTNEFIQFGIGDSGGDDISRTTYIGTTTVSGYMLNDYYYLGYIVTRDYGEKWQFELTPIQFCRKDNTSNIIGSYQSIDVIRTAAAPDQWPYGKVIGDCSPFTCGSYNRTRDRFVGLYYGTVSIMIPTVDLNAKTATFTQEIQFSTSGSTNIWADDDYIYTCTYTTIYKYTWAGTLVATGNITGIPSGSGVSTCNGDDYFYYVAYRSQASKGGSVWRVRKSNFSNAGRWIDITYWFGMTFPQTKGIAVDDNYVYVNNLNRITGYNKTTGLAEIELYGYSSDQYDNYPMIPSGPGIYVYEYPTVGGTIRVDYKNIQTGEVIFSSPNMSQERLLAAGPYWFACTAQGGRTFIMAGYPESLPNSTYLISPDNGSNISDVSSPIVFTWHSAITGSTDQIQIATDSEFSTIVEDHNVIGGTASYTLESSQTYYWRVRLISTP